MELNKRIFREYDIRGIYNDEMDEKTAYYIGLAYGTKLRELGKLETVVGYDNRLSSPVLEEQIIKGLTETGINVKRLGLVTTPMCYFAANYLETNASMMITASHNPKEYNGFKFSYNGIHNACGDEVKEIYEKILSKNFMYGKGQIEEVDIQEAYLELIKNSLDIGPRKLKIIYDCGNGTTSIIADKVFNYLGIEAIPMFNISDGLFPNHHPDPCIYENLTQLKQKVLEEKADIGIGYDGDGDRLGILDEQGNMIETDKLMIILWRFLHDKVDKKEGMFDVKCSKALEDELIKLGIKPVECRTGNSYTRRESARGNYPIGGEYSGHLYLRDKFPGYDDGIYNSLRIIELLTHINKPLSSLLEGINKYYTTSELKVPVADDIKFEVIEEIKEYCLKKGYNTLTIDGAKAKFEDGFALVRASNTGPNITLRFEAKTEERLNQIKEEFTKELNKHIKDKNN